MIRIFRSLVLGVAAMLPAAEPAAGHPAVLDALQPDLLMPTLWGLGGTLVPGLDGYVPGDVRPVADEQHPDAVQVDFPPSPALPERSLNLRLAADLRITEFAMWLKGVSGGAVTLSVWAPRRQRHYRLELSLTADWRRVEVPLSALRFDGEPSDRLTAAELGNLQFFCGPGALRFLCAGLVSTATGDGADGAVVVTRPRDRAWAFRAGEMVVPAWRVASTPPGPVRLSVLARRADGLERQAAELVDAGPAGVVQGVSLGMLPSGCWRVVATIEGGGGRRDCSEELLVVAPTMPVAELPAIGVNIDDAALSGGQFDSLARAGLTLARVWCCSWRAVEPQRGSGDWSVFDRLFQRASTAGIRLLPILQGAPPWAIMPPSEPPPWKAHPLTHGAPADQAAWGAFVRAVVERYRSRVPAWEIWNEPDWQGPPDHYFWSSTADYLSTLSTAYAAAKEADPACLVLSGGISMHPRFTERGFARSLAEAQARRPLADAMAVHGYGGLPPMLEAVGHFRAVAPGAACWQTEVGIAGEAGTDLAVRQRLRRYQERACEALAAGFVHYSFFQVAPGSGEHNLLDPHGGPTPDLVGIAVLARALGGARPQAVVMGAVRGFRLTTPMGDTAVLFGPGRVQVRAAAPVTVEDALGDPCPGGFDPILEVGQGMLVVRCPGTMILEP